MSDDRKEKIREGIRVASRTHKKKSIASSIGCAPQTLSTFTSGGPLGEELQDKAELWLKECGFWPKAEKPKDGVRLLAKDLRSLADILDSSDYPSDFKFRKFVAWIEFAHTEIDTLKKTFETKSNDVL